MWRRIEHEPVWEPANLPINAAGNTRPGFVCTHELENGSGRCDGNVFTLDQAVGTHACIVESIETRSDLSEWSIAYATLWDADQPVAWVHGDQLVVNPAYTDRIWALLGDVFTPGDDVVERVATAMRPVVFNDKPDDEVGPATQDVRAQTRRTARNAITAIAGGTTALQHVRTAFRRISEDAS